MNIIVMAKGAGLGAWVDSDFTHAHQIVYVPACGGFDALENPFFTDSSETEESSEALAEFVISKFPGAEAIIAGSFNQKTREYFESHNVAVFTELSGSVLELVEKIRAGAQA